MPDAAVWIDHQEAKIFLVSRESATEWKLHPHDRHPHLHHKAGLGDSGRAPQDQHYFHGVAEAVKDAGEILIAGPGTAKSELFNHLKAHDPSVAAKVVAVEPLDHPSDGQLLKLARTFFKAAERMHAPPR